MPNLEKLVHLFMNGQYITFSMGLFNDCELTSSFGGPANQRILCKDGRDLELHFVAEIKEWSIQFDGGGSLYLPLVFGIQYDGCMVEYEYSWGEIVIDRISPETPDKKWPYENYPKLLPYFAMKPDESKEMLWSEFSSMFPGLEEEQPAEVVAIVEPLFFIGHSLWGRHGDKSGATLVFECNYTERKVRARVAVE